MIFKKIILPVDDNEVNLSAREWEVMILLSNGYTVTEIAEKIELSVKTVSTYRHRILEKTGFSNNVELALAAAAQGLVGNTNAANQNDKA